MGFADVKIFAQKLPITNLYCAHVQNINSNSWVVNKLELLNSFNYHSYNNQPYFINNDEILCTVQTQKDTNTDIYKLNLQKKSLQGLIVNKGKDYSPRINNNYSNDITTVHINENDTVQKLVAFDSQNGEFKKVIFDKIGQVGYYRHLDGDQWVCFLVDQPNNLMAICNSRTKEKKIFASSIGRTFESLSSHEILFVHKILNDNWLLKSYDTETQQMKLIARMPPESEDFVILPNGNVLCTSGSKIMLLDRDKSIWNSVIDFSELGITHLGRITIKNNLVVLVDEVK